MKELRARDFKKIAKHFYDLAYGEADSIEEAIEILFFYGFVDGEGEWVYPKEE